MTTNIDQFQTFKRRVKFTLLAVLIYASQLLLIIYSPDESHWGQLWAMMIVLPLFAFQVSLLLKVALTMNYMVNLIRSRQWYDEHGPVNQLKTVQNRIGTEGEGPYDSVAMAIQFAANSFLIGVMLLCFFLMRSGNSVG